MQHRGPGSKAVVWAHNSHIGNAEFTEMGQVRGEHNIGQLARDRFGDKAALIGFGTDRGTVAAASDWNGPMEIKRVQARAGRFLRGQLARRRHPGLLPGDGPRPEEACPRRAGRAAARARHRCHLPARDGVAVTLFPGRIVAAIRCLDLVHRDARPWRRTAKPIRTAPTRPTPSGCSNIHSHSAGPETLIHIRRPVTRIHIIAVL